MQLVDTHCHLDRLNLDQYKDGLDGALAFAKSKQVMHFLCVAISLPDYPSLLEMAKRYACIDVSVGVHPNEDAGNLIDVDALDSYAQDPSVVAIGETGLDYFRSEGDLNWQQQRFREHIEVAKSVKKPLIIHTREAAQDTLKILKEENAQQVGGIMHCFVEDWEIAKAAMDLNFLISFSGIVTFKNATVLHDVAVKVPADKILIETDSPYLAPVPYRGKSNQPAYVYYVAEYLAKLRQTTIEDIAKISWDNYFSLIA